MDLLRSFLDFFLHIDEHLAVIIQQYGGWTYLILFLIIFCETGLVVTPFLPGDSLLFAAGALVALDTSGTLNIFLLIGILIIAAIAGDTVNYAIGRFIGTKLLDRNIPFLKKEYLDRTYAFYEKHGGKTIILARFVPIVRTFAPFVAGIGHMNYGRFLAYNVVGGIIWIVLFTLAGFFLGSIPIIKNNFELAAILIVLVSVLPMVIEFVRERRRGHNAKQEQPSV